MPLSKIWLFLLCLLCGLFAVLLLALEPELYRREVDEQTQRLLRAQPVASQFFANQAHQLLDAAVHMSSDAILQTTLSEMERGHSELPLLHNTAQAQLRQLNREFGATLVFCTDSRGRVLARVGHDEAVYRDPVDGFPLVEAALRGYRLDDLWLLDGALYRLAASPVVAPGHDRYVGALVVGQVLGSDVVRQLKRMTGVDAVFLAAGKLVSSSLAGPPPDPQLLVAARVPSSASGTTPGAQVVRGPQPGPERLLSFVDMPGEAAQQGALLVLAAEIPPGQTLPTLLRGAARHLRPTPGLFAALGAAALLYLIGLAILRVERPRPVYIRERAAPAPPPAPVPAPPSRSLPSVGSAVTAVASAHSAETVVASPIMWESAASAPSADDTAKNWDLPPPNSNFEPTLVAGSASSTEGSDPDASFYQVFQEYVLAREHCRESVEGISYEQFRQRLQESRAEIIRQHGCRNVEFRVYIKEGRAALRATPLWK